MIKNYNLVLFNSLQFLVFLPAVIVVYYLLAPKYRWILLLAASYYFYMCWRVEYVFLIILSTLVDYYAAIQMDKQEEQHNKKKYLILSLGVNLGLLFFFKYFNFLGNSLDTAFDTLRIPVDIPYLNILLPVGISFYTFQTLSYTIDVYKGRKKPERHLGIFAVYVAYFPQLVAGPIERSTHLLPQFHQKISLNYSNLSAGVKYIIWGYFLKTVVADRAAIYVDAVYNNVADHGGLTFLAATLFFGFQIYGDFAGYSLIAIGSSRMMGIKLMDNFNRPYFATSIRDFWRRWHISLSTWFRDYLYIPLGGNRTRTERWLFNLFITFLISGLWHGANWTFVIWGALHGFYLIVEALFFKRERKGIINVAITYALVSLAWVFFRANSVNDAFYILYSIALQPGSLFIPGGADTVSPVFAVLAISFLLLVEVKKEYFNHWFSITQSKYEWVRMGAYASMIFLILYVGVFGESQFIYFQF